LVPLAVLVFALIYGLRRRRRQDRAHTRPGPDQALQEVSGL
jgi:hypothetical protein